VKKNQPGIIAAAGWLVYLNHVKVRLRAPPNSFVKAQRVLKYQDARRASPLRVIPLTRSATPQIGALELALRGLQTNSHPSLPLFDVQQACLQSGVSTVNSSASLSYDETIR